MKSYIEGYYAPSIKVLRVLSAEEKRKTFDILLKSYPAAMNIKDIAANGNVKYKTAHGSLAPLENVGLIRKVDESKETGGGDKYATENVNSLLRDKYPNYSLAPGIVSYSDEFKNTLDRLVDQQEIKTQFSSLLEFVKYIDESVKAPNERPAEKIRPENDSSYICSMCGLNHEARDFIRATLLYLLDQFERSPHYLEFLKERNYIDKKHYNEYCEFVETNLGQQISERLVAETQFKHSKSNDRQTVTEKLVPKDIVSEGQSVSSKRSDEEILAKRWYEKKEGLTKDLIDYILDKTGISMVQLKKLADSRMIGRSYLDAIYKAGKEDLGVSYSDDLVVGYDKRKKQEAYENRVRDKTVELDKKRKAAQSV